MSAEMKTNTLTPDSKINHQERLISKLEKSFAELQTRFNILKDQKEKDDNLNQEKNLEAEKFFNERSKIVLELETQKVRSENLEKIVKTLEAEKSSELRAIIDRNMELEEINKNLSIELENKNHEIIGLNKTLNDISKQMENLLSTTKKNNEMLGEELKAKIKKKEDDENRFTQELKNKNQEIENLNIQIQKENETIKLTESEIEKLKNEIEIIKNQFNPEAVTQKFAQFEEKINHLEAERVHKENEVISLKSEKKSLEDKFTEESANLNSTLKKKEEELNLSNGKIKSLTGELERSLMLVESLKKANENADKLNMTTILNQRLQDMSYQMEELQKKYFKEVENARRFESLAKRLQIDHKASVDNFINENNETMKKNYNLLLSKLQQSISINKSLNLQIEALKTDNDSKTKENISLQEKQEQMLSQIRILKIENYRLSKILKASENVESEIEEYKDVEIKNLSQTVENLKAQIQEISKNSVKSEEAIKLRSDLEEKTKQLNEQQEISNQLLEQIKTLKKVEIFSKALNSGMDLENPAKENNFSAIFEDPSHIFAKNRFEFDQIKAEFIEKKKEMSQEIDKLKFEIETKNSEIQNLRIEKNLLEVKYESTKKELETLNQKYSGIKDSQSNFEQEKKDFKVENQNLSITIKELTEEIQKKSKSSKIQEEKIKRLNDFNIELLDQNKYYLSVIHELKLKLQKHSDAIIDEAEEKNVSTINSLREELNAEKKKTVEYLMQINLLELKYTIKYENQNVVIVNLKKKLQFDDEIIKNLKSDIERIRNLSASNSKGDSLDLESKNLKQLLEMQHQQEGEISKVRAALEAKIEILESEAKKSEENFTKEIQNKTTNLDQYKTTLDRYKHEYARQLKEYQDKTQEENELEFNKMRDLIKSLRKEKAQAINPKPIVFTSINTKIKFLESQINGYKETIEMKDFEIRELKEEIQKLNSDDVDNLDLVIEPENKTDQVDSNIDTAN